MKLINSIHFRNLTGDAFGGLTAAIVALPMALAFGVASGAGAIAGLYCAILLGFFAALFGGTPTLISNPTGPMTVVMTAVLARMTASDPEQGMAMAFTVVMLAGVFQIIFGACKLGKFITLMPYTVISGFMSGIGLIMVLLQIAPFLGQVNRGGIKGAIINLPEYISNANSAAIILASMTLAVIFLVPGKVRRFLPPQLIALILGTIISLVVFGDSDLARIGEIPISLPKLQFPTFSADRLEVMLLDAVMLGMLGCIDSLLTSVIADSITQTQHDSDKELIGQGIGNIICGVFGGLPGAGATMGTVVNIQAGGRTVLSGMIHSGILLVIVLGAAPLTQPIPHAVLAGILVKVGLDIIDWKFLKRAHRLSLRTAAIMYGVMLLTVFVDLIVAVGVGVFVANILTIKRLADIQSDKVKAITAADDETPLSTEEKALLRQASGQVLLLHLGGPMSFGAAKAISQQQVIMQNYRVLILDLSDLPLLGVTATLAIESLLQEARKRHVEVFLVRGSAAVQTRLARFDILKTIPESHQLGDRQTSLERALGSLLAEV
ncbi:SulP family inorganic anion transporter [Candidatus Synechococcus calcipolaris G9]|uniref:SulP family inorganic anion transporter n=1 Tax=Candidatus Synechococcus calcipolaris G9 TaxID=1497997 RepID=A0ABT6EWA5_9SYNE|nr:SulP family inorganic anion transporter [Candidatus Synechococcus calcipolaris]MDG2990056.1 SulP family inorganic anion transporter [Candidatus Synechococcus calcipolaris G9]